MDSLGLTGTRASPADAVTCSPSIFRSGGAAPPRHHHDCCAAGPHLPHAELLAVLALSLLSLPHPFTGLALLAFAPLLPLTAVRALAERHHAFEPIAPRLTF